MRSDGYYVMCTICDRYDNTKSTAAAASECPEQILVLIIICSDIFSTCKDNCELNDIVDTYMEVSSSLNRYEQLVYLNHTLAKGHCVRHPEPIHQQRRLKDTHHQR